MATVKTVDDVRAMMAELLSNGKIARATHNMLAYRIRGSDSLPGSGILQDCDDDGETGAGSRMLHLLQILEVMDVAVVVTRWYGGIHLGPDRFKHINNATRYAAGRRDAVGGASRTGRVPVAFSRFFFHIGRSPSSCCQQRPGGVWLSRRRGGW